MKAPLTLLPLDDIVNGVDGVSAGILVNTFAASFSNASTTHVNVCEYSSSSDRKYRWHSVHNKWRRERIDDDSCIKETAQKSKCSRRNLEKVMFRRL